ncbi:MAG: hypothetical protein WC990_06525 [Sphaerochaetaceae bacterium]
MGQQQILLIVLSVILVGIAIAVGITMFKAQAEQSNIDAIAADLNNLGAMAYQYSIRPVSMGGGFGDSGKSYVGFTIPAGMDSNSNGKYYVATGATATSITLVAQSATDDDIIKKLVVDKDGKMTLSDGEASLIPGGTGGSGGND